MTAEVEPDSPARLVLEVPDEPLELRALLRAAVGESPVAGREVALSNVTELFCGEWHDALAVFAVDEEQFGAIVAGATNEVWLWVMGDRPFDQLVASIAGRTIRRTA
jgi:hypothetical protein